VPHLSTDIGDLKVAVVKPGESVKPGVYRHSGNSLRIEAGGRITVQPGDSISKYALCLYGNALVGWNDFGRLAGNKAQPLANVNVIQVGSTLVHIPTHSTESQTPSIESKIASRLYVVRRPLGLGEDWKPLTNLNQFAHSAVLIETNDRQFVLLEYMGDSKVYLTPVTPTTLETHFEDSYITLQMKGAMANGVPQMYRWTRQLHGVALANSVSVSDLREAMERQVSVAPYSLFFHNCHKAQETLRRSLGLPV